MPHRLRRHVIAAAGVALGTVATISVADVSRATAALDPIASLAGRWSGLGTVVPASGTAENFKCVITYLPERDGAAMKQNLRCKSDSYRLETSTTLEVSGKALTGRWEEKVHGLDGSVSGVVTSDGFDVVLAGRFFRARMAVSGTGCEQSVRVSPERTDYIREVSASLRKC